MVSEIKNDREVEVGSRMSEMDNGDGDTVIPFYVAEEDSQCTPPVGLLSQTIVSAIQNDHRECVATTGTSPWRLHYGEFKKLASISFAPWVNRDGRSARTTHIERIVHGLKEDKRNNDFLRGMKSFVQTHIMKILI